MNLRMQGSNIAAAVLAAGLLVSAPLAAAQEEPGDGAEEEESPWVNDDDWCADCSWVIPLVTHIFVSVPEQKDGSGIPPGSRECDNNGGCHFVEYILGCSWHDFCFNPSDQQELLDVFATPDPAAMASALSRLDRDWEHDPTTESVRVLCGGLLVLRLSVESHDWAEVVHALEAQPAQWPAS